jgi:hypothetical protein
MEQDKKRLKREYARLVSKLQRVLRRFTPIDPSDEDSIRDEYEPLAPTLVSMLMRGCSREELFRAIESHRANHWSSVPANSELGSSIGVRPCFLFSASSSHVKVPVWLDLYESNFRTRFIM